MRFLGAAGAGDEDAVRHEGALGGGEERGRGDAVWEAEEEHKGPEEGRDPQDDVHPLPWAQGRLDVSDPVGEQARDESADRVPGEPDACAHGHLVARVPGRGDEHEGRRDGRLGDAEEEPHGEEAAVVDAGGREGDDGAPEEGVGCQVFGDREAWDEQVRRRFPEEVAEVEDAGDPAVLLADEVLVCEWWKM